MVSHVWSPPKTRYRGSDLSIKKSAFDSLVAISLLITLPQAAEAEELDNRLVHQAIRCGTGFIPNRGQWSKDVSFGCATKSGVFFVANGSIFAGINVYNTSSQIAGRDWIQFEFVGANGSAEASGRHSRKSTTSFFRGKDPSKWVSSLPSFDDVYVADYYPGIDLALRVKRTGIEYDFLLDANVDPSTIRMRIVGATAITESTNRLEISTPFGSLVQKAPRAFQMNADGSWAETPCRVVKWEHGIYGFLLPERDPRLPVCIDPDVAAPDWYFSYLGGNDGFLPSAPQTPNQGEDQFLMLQCRVVFSTSPDVHQVSTFRSCLPRACFLPRRPSMIARRHFVREYTRLKILMCSLPLSLFLENFFGPHMLVDQATIMVIHLRRTSISAAGLQLAAHPVSM